jgi:ribonuclease P protein component
MPVLRKGKPVFSRCGKILSKKNTHGFPRMGVIVSKKAARLAVTRNRVKRIVRDVFRQSQSSLPNLDLVFIARSSSGQATNEELRLCIQKMLTQLQKSASPS